MSASSSSSPVAVPRIREGDFVMISGGGARRVVEVRKGVQVRLGRAGDGLTHSLVGLRYGEVVELHHPTRRFVATNRYPDLDLTTEHAAEDTRDNRGLQDDNQSQRLSNHEVAALRKECSMDDFLHTLVENSATFQSKTNFAQEKYLRKKQKKYGVLYKVERVVPDNLAELHLPTIHPSDAAPEETRVMRLRADTVALVLHHADVHDGSRVLLYDKTNGVLAAYLLTRLGSTGEVWQVMDRATHPNTFTAIKVMQLPAVKERWKAVPRNDGLLHGTEPVAPAQAEDASGEAPARRVVSGGVSQWVRGLDARARLLERPPDSLVIADDDAPGEALRELLPFVALGGHVVVYSSMLDHLTGLFATLWSQAVHVRLSETWYRHHQVLPGRTHPTVNMSTAGGYLLTAIKVEPHPHSVPAAPDVDGDREGRKRGRDPEVDDAVAE